MAIGDVSRVTAGDVTDCYYLDTGMYDVEAYGSVYLLDAERPAVVDTGIGTRYEAILEGLETVGIDPSELAVIAPTHVHLDHAGGAGYLAAACPDAAVAVHEIGAPHLIDPERLVEGTKRAVGDQWAYYADPKPVPEDRVRSLTDGDVIDLGEYTLEAKHAPGHAPHQMVYHMPENDAVFTADAAGINVPDLDGVYPTSPPPNFDLEQCLADVAMLQELDPAVLCYGHFGPAETGDNLAVYERVLTDWVERIETVRTELEDDDAVIEHFVEEQWDELEPVWGDRKARAETTMNVRGVLHYLDQQADQRE
ncbi:MAG: MBL fold metallo-hydrolase [Halobacteriales archaeon]|nr:MBL fold metallo-hydrolase [Halobacteriales archaeon]